MVRAALALAEHQPQEAVAVLDVARNYQMRSFHVVYLRARAEAGAGQLDAAAADFRWIVDHPGIDPLSVEIPLAHLQLARIFRQQNRIDEARSQYQAFFNAWKNADAGLPVLVDARHEFAALQ
jgi:predicted negative regulator of RcsB-dependent stress response